MAIRHPRPLCTILLALLAFAPALRAADKPAFELKDGDRIAYIGGTFVERDADYSYLETLLVSRYPDRNFTFRNLGWAGDTVTGQARAMFGKPADGFNRLRSEVERLKPTVLLVAYGMSESFDGEAKLPEFEKNLNAMLDMLAAAAAPGARVVLISPIMHEDCGRPLPDPTKHNADLKLYVEAIRRTADKRGATFVDLFSLDVKFGTWNIAPPPPHPVLTFDGIQLAPVGYAFFDGALAGAMRIPAEKWELTLDASGKVTKAAGVTANARNDRGKISITCTDSYLIYANQAGIREWRQLIITGLEHGTYVLKSGTVALATAPSDEWARSVLFIGGPADQQFESLRKLIVSKNVDYFNRWRPANDTYIFGFRKHEQGRNAAEIPQFDPIIAQKEEQIAKLKVPQPVTYTLEKQ